MPKEPPRLDGGLIVRKGEATPVVTAAQPPAAQPVATVRAVPPKGTAGTIAVTVRLDPERYERLKVYGARSRKTNQQIIVAALDAHLSTEEHG